MPVPGEQSYADEFRALSKALEQAGRIAASLKELHEHEMRNALKEVQELKQQLSISQQGCSLPNHVVQAGHEARLPLKKSGIVEGAGNGRLRSLRKSGCNQDSTDEEGHVRFRSLRESGCSQDRTDEEGHVRFRSLRESGCSQDSTDEEGRVRLRSLRESGCSQDSSSKIEIANLSPTSSLASDEVQLVSQQSTSDRFLSRSSTSKPKNTLWAEEVTKVGGIRSIWENAKEESVEAALSRCSVHVIEGNDVKSNRRTIRLSRAGSFHIASIQFCALLVRCRLCCTRFACSIMDPVGPIRCFWNAMCLLFIACDLILVPLQAFRLEDVTGLQAFEWVSTCWWTFDVYMTFRTGFVSGSRVEMRPWKIAVHYARTWLLVDIVIVVLEWINRFAVAFGSVSLLRSSRALRTFRFIKMFRVTKMHSFWKTLQEQVNSNIMHLCMTMTVLGFILLLVIHTTCCVWFAIGESRDDGWISYDIYPGKKDDIFWYMTSFRWVVSQVNGRTDIDERRNMQERLFTCFCGVSLAIFAQAFLVSVITKTMLDLSAIVSEKTRRRSLVNDYLEANPLPPMLRQQVRRSLHDYQDVGQEMQKEIKVLSLLSKHLQSDILEAVRSPLLRRHPFFNAVQFEFPGVMRVVCRKVVETCSAAKDEVVFDRGDMCERMFFTDKLTLSYGVPPDSGSYSFTSCFASEDEITRKKSRPFGRFTQHQKSKYGAELLECEGHKRPKQIPRGSWVSEPAIWLEWRNQGRLISNGHGVLLNVQAGNLAQDLKAHHDAFALANIYAKHFATEIHNRDPGDLSDVIPWEIQMHSPLSLQVTVVSARGLRNADGFIAGKSDPYCICKVFGVTGKSGETRFKTHTIDNTSDPVWNHSAEVHLSWHQFLEFHIWDYDYGKADESLGSARMYPEEFAQCGFEGELPLKDSHHKLVQGFVKVKISVSELEEPPSFHLWHTRSQQKNGVKSLNRALTRVFNRQISITSDLSDSSKETL